VQRTMSVTDEDPGEYLDQIAELLARDFKEQREASCYASQGRIKNTAQI